VFGVDESSLNFYTVSLSHNAANSTVFFMRVLFFPLQHWEV